MRHRFLAKWLICFVILLAFAYCFPLRFDVRGGLFSLAVAATMLWLVNLIIRPVLQLLALPVTLLTFGFFSLVVNAGMVGLTDFLLPSIRIHGFLTCLFIALLISIANSLLGANRSRS